MPDFVFLTQELVVIGFNGIIRIALGVTLILQSVAPSMANGQVSRAVIVQSGGEILRSLFVDLRTALGPNSNIKITYEKQNSTIYNIQITAAESNPYRMSIRFGTAELAGIPVEMITPNGRLDLTADWKNQFELFHSPPATAAEATSLVSPIATKIANFIVKDQKTRASNRARAMHQTNDQDESWKRYAKLNKIEDRVMKISLGVGATVAAVGAYMMFGMGDSYRFSMLPLGVFLSGTAIVTLNFMNSLPELLEHDRSFLGQLLESWFEKRAAAREAIAYAKEGAKEHVARAEAEAIAANRTYSFGKVDLVLSMGSITNVKADAWIVPHFQSGENAGGVLNAVARTIGDQDAAALERIANEKGKMPFGSVTVTRVQSVEHTRFLFNAVTVYSANELNASAAEKTRAEFALIRDTLFESLKQASAMGLSSIALPLMGTGILGVLPTDSTSMQALFEAVQRFNSEFPNAAKLKVTVAAFTDRTSFSGLQSFAENTERAGIKASPQLNARSRTPIVKMGTGNRCEAMFAPVPR